MKASHLHIISFNVPYPANYGGVIDVFFRIKALAKQGVKITLHCFDYGRGKQPELELLCEKVYYYKRTRHILHFLSLKPFIVQSRKNKQLLENLCADTAPILFEGIHTCGFLSHPKLKHRFKIVRTHNVEHHYYKALFDSSKHPYYLIESWKLRCFEPVLEHANSIVTISEGDTDYFKHKFNHVIHIGSNHPFDQPNITCGTGAYALYHGNLSVDENIRSAAYLVNKVIPNCKLPFIIAGKQPSARLKKMIEKCDNVSLVESPDDKTMFQLMHNAQMHVLPTFQATGLKLKLLYAIFNGRHCIVNRAMVQGTNLDQICLTTANTSDLISTINATIYKPFSEANRAKKIDFLNAYWANNTITDKWLQLLEKTNELH